MLTRHERYIQRSRRSGDQASASTGGTPAQREDATRVWREFSPICPAPGPSAPARGAMPRAGQPPRRRARSAPRQASRHRRRRRRRPSHEGCRSKSRRSQARPERSQAPARQARSRKQSAPARSATARGRSSRERSRARSAAERHQDPAPRQGFETESDPVSGPVQPPGGVDLLTSAAELAGELAKTRALDRRAPAQGRPRAAAAQLSLPCESAEGTSGSSVYCRHAELP